MKIAVAVVFLLVLRSAVAAYRRSVTYEERIVIRCNHINTSRFQTLLSEDSVDIWGVGEDGRLDICLSRQLWTQLHHNFSECEVIIHNVENYVLKAEQLLFNATQAKPGWFEAYHEYDDIVSWYKELADDYKDIVEYSDSIGFSIENRRMPAVHITKNLNPEKFRIYFQCQIHAREWISGAVCMYIANYLCENYGKNKEVTDLLDTLEFVIIPFVNPDGYVYTWTTDRLWRKNRRQNPGSSCDGVDLNRNYNEHWGGGGSSSNPCSETYHGSSASSEPETRNTKDYFRDQAPIIGAIDWHSFSQLILRPYGWTSKNCPDEPQLKSIGDEMSSLIYQVHENTYESEKSNELYLTTGTASDWFYSEDATQSNGGYRAAGFTIELRDTGEYGFLLPPDQIIPNGEEIVPAVIFFAKTLYSEPIKS